MAGFFPEEFLSEVLARNDIVDVIGEYVQLRRRGQSYWGLCPFHGEKTPSFSVSQDKQFYYCFGCHAGGNAFQFLQNLDKCDFSEAVETLARRANLPMPERKNDADHREREELRTRLYEIGRAAGRFYHDKLYSREGLKALEYLQRRGVTERIIKRFGLGYAPEHGDECVRFLEAQGFSREHLKLFAVAGEKDGRWYDYFRNRVMYPIIDRRDRVIGFGGRVMDDSQPKYLNSPETPVFNKRLNLFGLNLVQKIRNLQRLVIVEGYMDVIGLHQADLPYAVASLGTALTEDQARLIKRYCDEVYIAYDGDSAGQKATARGLDILKEAGLRVQVIEFPDKMDPDDYARKFGRVGVEELMDKAITLIDYKLKAIANGCDLATEEGRRQYVTRSSREVLAQIDSPVEMDILVKRLSRETGVSAMAIQEEAGLERAAARASAYSAKGGRNTNAVVDGPSRVLEIRPSVNTDDNAAAEAERTLLLLALQDPAHAENLVQSLDLDELEGPRRGIAQAIFEGRARNAGAAELMNTLAQEEQSELARILLTNLDEQNREAQAQDCMKALRQRRMRRRIDALKNEIVQPGLPSEEKFHKMQELSTLQKKIKGIETI